MTSKPPSQRPVMNNIVFHQGALGDWVLIFPILRALEGQTLAVAARSKAQLAARIMPHVEPCDIEQRDAALLFSEDCQSEITDAWRGALSRAEQIISFVSGGEGIWAGNVRRLAPQSRIAFVNPRPVVDWTGHLSTWHRRQLVDQDIVLPDAPMSPAVRRSGPLIVHPGSGGRDKCWPVGRFERLLTAFRHGGQEVRVLLGEVELETWPPTMIEAWRRDYQAELIETLDSLRRVLDTAGGYIGNDSGPTHLAAAMGLPTLALFGPTDPRRWGPCGPAVTVLAPPKPREMTWLDVATVLAACGVLV